MKNKQTTIKIRRAREAKTWRTYYFDSRPMGSENYLSFSVAPESKPGRNFARAV